MIKTFKIILFTLLLSLPFNVANSETLNFSVGIWEGDVKKGKAHGKGVLTFKNGAVYEGKISKNRIHGAGKLISKDGEVYDGKWRYGKFYQKIDKKTRKIIILQTEGRFYWERHEIKGKGQVRTKWFEAEKTSSGITLTSKGKKDMETAIKEALAGGGGGDSGGGGGGGGGC